MPDGAAAVFPVEDEPALLDRMMADAAAQPAVWAPTGYWQPYARRMRRELDRGGLHGFRRSRVLLKGFAVGGAPAPNLPAAAWKRGLWNLVERLPVVSRIRAEYARLVSSEHKSYVEQMVLLARLMLDEVRRDYPGLAIPRGLGNGAPLSAFDWNGHVVEADWVTYLARAAEFYKAVPRKEVRALLEIGPGLGLYGLAHLALNPHLRLVVNVDIPPVSYVSTQYLKSFPDLEVIDYAATHALPEIVLEPGADRPRVYQLLPWQLPAVRGGVDLFVNMASFQEMDRTSCANYIRHVSPLTRRFVLLQNARADVAEIAAQGLPDIDFMVALFAERFPAREALESGWIAFLESGRGRTVLLRATP